MKDSSHSDYLYNQDYLRKFSVPSSTNNPALQTEIKRLEGASPYRGYSTNIEMVHTNTGSPRFTNPSRLHNGLPMLPAAAGIGNMNQDINASMIKSGSNNHLGFDMNSYYSNENTRMIPAKRPCVNCAPVVKPCVNCKTEVLITYNNVMLRLVKSIRYIIQYLL